MIVGLFPLEEGVKRHAGVVGGWISIFLFSVLTRQERPAEEGLSLELPPAFEVPGIRLVLL